ncbi:MAG: DUF6665 family protein [Flavobacteriaceae bacterium]
MRAAPAGSGKGHSSFAAVEHELFTEQAGTLIRITRRFEAALEALKQCSDDDPARQRRTREAAHALWVLVVQRDCLGLPGTARLIADYDVPAEVRILSGVAIPLRRRHR